MREATILGPRYSHVGFVSSPPRRESLNWDVKAPLYAWTRTDSQLHNILVTEYRSRSDFFSRLISPRAWDCSRLKHIFVIYIFLVVDSCEEFLDLARIIFLYSTLQNICISMFACVCGDLWGVSHLVELRSRYNILAIWSMLWEFLVKCCCIKYFSLGHSIFACIR